MGTTNDFSTLFEFWDKIPISEAITKEDVGQHENVNSEEHLGDSGFTKIPDSHQLVILPIITIIGFILNSVILRIYWNRFLIVALPHKFQLYETKMRIFKFLIFSLTFFCGLTGLFPEDIIQFFIVLAMVNLVAQFLACIGLYTFIVARVVMSERKMNKHRHIGSG